MQKKFSFLLIILLLVCIFLVAKSAKAGLEHNLSGWAWSENIGWISFNSTNCDRDGDGTYEGANEGGGTTPAPNGCPTSGTVISYGVNVNTLTGNLSGYAWSENIGLIDFAPAGPYPAAPSYSARADLVSWQVSGWTRACSIFATNCSGALNLNEINGGWDGWLRLRGFIDTNQNGTQDVGENNYGIWLDRDVTPNEFQEWTWGSDPEGNAGEGVIGWVSFNNLNCDPDDDGLSEGLGSCPPINTSIPGYEVTYSPAENPSVDNMSLGASDYCSERLGPLFSPGQGIIEFKWVYQDDDPESRWDLRVNDTDNVNAGLEVDLSFSGLNNPSGTINHQIVTVDISSQPNQLIYNTTYYWWVKVWDSEGYYSNWVAGSSFSTPLHASPYPNFNPSPSNPKVSQVVEFADSSQCWDNGNAGYNCNTPPAEINPQYQWNFDFIKDGVENGVIDSTNRGTTDHSYTEEGTYTAKLEITDNIDTCPTERNIIVKPLIPPPKWKEIPPTSWFIKNNFSSHSIQKILADISNFSVSFLNLTKQKI